MRSRGLDRVKKKVKFLKKLENRCMSVDTLFYSKGVYKVVMCRNIQALVNTVVLTPASCPKGDCGHGKTIFGAGVNELLIVHKGTCFECLRCRCETCDCRIGEVEVFL